MTNPYEAWAGGGRVSGREKLKKLDDDDVEMPGHDIDPSLPRYKGLNSYLPSAEEKRELHVYRYAPIVSDMADAHLKLGLVGKWVRITRTALERLDFKSQNANKVELPLISTHSISLSIPTSKWKAYGKVQIHELKPDPKKERKDRKVYSRVMFIHEDGEKVAAYWCWPY